MDNNILHLKINALMDVLNSKGLVTDAELEVINKSLIETMELTDNKSKEKIKEYLF